MPPGHNGIVRPPSSHPAGIHAPLVYQEEQFEMPVSACRTPELLNPRVRARRHGGRRSERPTRENFNV